MLKGWLLSQPSSSTKEMFISWLSIAGLNLCSQATLLEVSDPNPPHPCSAKTSWYLFTLGTYFNIQPQMMNKVVQILMTSFEVGEKLILLMASSTPRIPSLRYNDIWHCWVIKDNSSIVSPWSSQVALSISIYVAVFENKTICIIRIFSSLCCYVSWKSMQFFCNSWYITFLQSRKI